MKNSSFKKRTLAGLLALCLVCGSTPMGEFSPIFGQTAIVADAASVFTHADFAEGLVVEPGDTIQFPVGWAVTLRTDTGEYVRSYDANEWTNISNTDFVVQSYQESEDALTIVIDLSVVEGQAPEPVSSSGPLVYNGEEQALVTLDTSLLKKGESLEYQTTDPLGQAEKIEGLYLQLLEAAQTAEGLDPTIQDDLISIGDYGSRCVRNLIEGEEESAKVNFGILSAKYNDLSADYQELTMTDLLWIDRTLDSVEEIRSAPESLDDLKSRLAGFKWSKELPTAKDVGTYQVGYRVLTSDPKAEPKVKYVVTEITSLVISLEDAHLEYTGKEQTLLDTSAIPDTVNIRYCLTGTDVLSLPDDRAEKQPKFDDAMDTFRYDLDISKDELKERTAQKTKGDATEQKQLDGWEAFNEELEKIYKELEDGTFDLTEADDRLMALYQSQRESFGYNEYADRVLDSFGWAIYYAKELYPALEWSEVPPKATDAGEYRIWCKFPDGVDPNVQFTPEPVYNALYVDSVISPKVLDVSVTSAERVYDGKPFTFENFTFEGKDIKLFQSLLKERQVGMFCESEATLLDGDCIDPAQFETIMDRFRSSSGIEGGMTAQQYNDYLSSISGKYFNPESFVTENGEYTSLDIWYSNVETYITVDGVTYQNPSDLVITPEQVVVYDTEQQSPETIPIPRGKYLRLTSASADSKANTIELELDIADAIQDTECVSVGMYHVYFTLNDTNYALSSSECDAEIKPVSFDPKGYSGKYDGASHQLISLDAEIPGDGTKVYYAVGDAEPFPSVILSAMPDGWSTEAPTASEIGEYPVQFQLYHENADVLRNYAQTSGSVTAEITSASPDYDIAPHLADGLTYDGTAQELVTPGISQNGTVVYSLDGKKFSETIPTGKDAGTYTVSYKIKGEDGFTDSAVESVEVTIQPMELYVAWADSFFIYNGKEQTFTAKLKGALKGDEKALKLTLDGNTATNAGVYTAAAVLSGDKAKNYTLMEDECEWSIAQVPVTVRANDVTITYGDKVKFDGVTIVGLAEGDTLGGELKLACDYKQFGDAGKYSITPSGMTNDNYLITFKKGKLTVAPKAASFVWDENVTFGYDGKAKTVTGKLDGIVNKDAIEVTYTGNTQTDAGEYTAAAAFTGDKAKNYKITAEPCNWSITAADPDVKADGFDGVYDGKAHGITVRTEAAGAAIYFSEEKLDEAGFVKAKQTKSPTYTDAGTYTVYYCITAPNCKTVTGSKTVTITEAAMTLKLTAKGWTEGEKAPAPVLTGAPEGAKITYAYFVKGSKTALKAAPTTAGDYTVKATVSAKNYQTASAAADFTIETKPQETTAATTTTATTTTTTTTQTTTTTDTTTTSTTASTSQTKPTQTTTTTSTTLPATTTTTTTTTTSTTPVTTTTSTLPATSTTTTETTTTTKPSDTTTTTSATTTSTTQTSTTETTTTSTTTTAVTTTSAATTSAATTSTTETTTTTETTSQEPEKQTVTKTMTVGDDFQLPNDEGTVYNAGDSNVVTVDEDGKLHAVQPGNAVVEVTLPTGAVIAYQITVEDVFNRGDVNLDGKVTAEDAAQMLIYAAAKGAGADTKLLSDDEALETRALRQADTNGDGKVNAEDAANDLIYAAIAGAEGKADWSTILGTPDETTA